jgi:hypothetical protein
MDLFGNKKTGKIGVLDGKKGGLFRHHCGFNTSFRTDIILQGALPQKPDDRPDDIKTYKKFTRPV